MSEGRRSDANLLERRARWLVRAYPEAYRADRGEEIIGTLLETTPPGRNWPPSRETVSVIAAGLHARREVNLRQGLSASLRQTAMVGAAVYLVQLPCAALREAVLAARAGRIPIPLGSYGWFYFSLGVLVMLILAAAWSGRRRLVPVAAVAAVIPAAIHTLISHEWDLMVLLAGFAGPALAVFLPFTRRTERLPASLLWLPCLPLGVTLAEALFPPYPALSPQTVSQVRLLFPYTTYLSLVTVVAAVCWLVTDVRPLAGIVFAFTVARVIYGFAFARSYGTVWSAEIAIAITASLVLACALVWLLRQRIRTSPPTTS